MANYVKFVRGLSDLFNKLTVKDSNTLQFIYENESSTSGRLYLGDREIVCNGSGSSVASYLKDLLDVSLPEDVSELIDGQVLTYDATTSKWVARDPSAVANVLFDADQFEVNDNGEWSLLGFANAPSGARLTKGADGKLIWDLPNGETTEELAELVEQLRTDVDSLTTKFNDYDTSAEVDIKIAEAVAAAGHLSYKTVDTIEEIDVSATGASQFIYLVKNGEVYDEYMVINGKLERVGDWNVDLSQYAKKTEVEQVASDLATTQQTVSNIVTRVESLENTSSQVEDLAIQLNSIDKKVKANEETIATHTTQISELQAALDEKADVDDLEEFKSAMSWKNLSDMQ